MAVCTQYTLCPVSSWLCVPSAPCVQSLHGCVYPVCPVSSLCMAVSTQRTPCPVSAWPCVLNVPCVQSLHGRVYPACPLMVQVARSTGWSIIGHHITTLPATNASRDCAKAWSPSSTGTVRVSVYVYCILYQLLEFYVLAKSKAISGYVPTCGSVYSWRLYSAAPLGDGAISTMTRYPTILTLS